MHIPKARVQGLKGGKTKKRCFGALALMLIVSVSMMVLAYPKRTTLSGKEVEIALPTSDTASSSSGGGFSLKISRPLVASSASSGSLRLYTKNETAEAKIQMH